MVSVRRLRSLKHVYDLDSSVARGPSISVQSRQCLEIFGKTIGDPPPAPFVGLWDELTATRRLDLDLSPQLTRDLMRITILLAILFSASISLAVPVTPNSPDGIAALFLYSGTYVLLCNDGDMWSLTNLGSPSAQWVPNTYTTPLPVPVSQISEFTLGMLTTISGERWIFVPVDNMSREEWRRVDAAGDAIPPLPCAGGVMESNESLGKLKALFR